MNADTPTASTTRMAKHMMINSRPGGHHSRNPMRMAATPVVVMPVTKRNFAPNDDIWIEIVRYVSIEKYNVWKAEFAERKLHGRKNSRIFPIMATWEIWPAESSRTAVQLPSLSLPFRQPKHTKQIWSSHCTGCWVKREWCDQGSLWFFIISPT